MLEIINPALQRLADDEAAKRLKRVRKKDAKRKTAKAEAKFGG
jgi:hypothetical protein